MTDVRLGALTRKKAARVSEKGSGVSGVVLWASEKGSGAIVFPSFYDSLISPSLRTPKAFDPRAQGRERTLGIFEGWKMIAAIAISACLTLNFQEGANKELAASLLALKDTDREKRRAAANEIHSIAAGDPVAVTKVLDQLIDALEDSDYAVRSNIAQALMRLKPAEIAGNSRLVPALVDVVENDRIDYAVYSAMVLAQFPKSAAPVLNINLLELNNDHRSLAIACLGWMGGDAEVAIGNLEKIARRIPKTDMPARLGVGEALVRISPGNRIGLEILEDLATCNKVNIRQFAALTLARSPKKASIAIPILRDIISDPNYKESDLFDDAMRAIWEAKAEASDLAATLKKILSTLPDENKKDYGEIAKLYSAATILYLHPNSRDAEDYLRNQEPRLLKLLQSRFNENDRYFAVVTLGKLSAKQAKQSLKSISELDSSKRVREAAKRSLSQIGN